MINVTKWGALKVGVAVGALLTLAGCVYGPGYGYVRGDGYNGDAYYGEASPAYSTYGGGYYGSGYGYGPYGYGYGYGYGPSIGLGLYYDNYGHRHYGHGGHGGWNGHDGSNGRVGSRAPGQVFRGRPSNGAGRSSTITRSAPSFSRGESSRGVSHSASRGGRRSGN